MARFSRIEVVRRMKETGVVPVFYHEEIDVCKQVLEASYSGGVRVFEFTNNGELAHEHFRELIVYCRENLPDLILGAGSIVDASTAALYIQLGANFIVSPVLNMEMGRVCNRRKIAWLPGCGSVTEISFAEELGAEVVKISPGLQAGGPDFVRAVKASLPWASIMAREGVEPTEISLKSWFDAGVHCVAIGSQLICQKILSENDFGGLTQQVKNVIAIVKQLKQEYMDSSPVT